MRQSHRALENGRRVIGDEVDARKLLHELTADTEHGSVEELLLSILEHGPVGTSLGCLTLFVNGVLNFFHFDSYDLLNVFVGCVLGEQGVEGQSGFVVLVLGNELLCRDQFLYIM